MKRLRKFVLPVLAVGMLAFTIYHVLQARQTPPVPPPPVAPARSPYNETVAGAGIVEPQKENISVGSPVPGVVVEVFAKVGHKVEKGERLFRLDDRQLQAELKLREAALAAVEAQLQRLEKQPRAEELPVSEARVREAETNLAQQQDQLDRARKLTTGGAIAAEEFINRRQAHRMAQEQLSRAKAEHELLKAGAWEPDKAVARVAVAQAKAQREQVKTELDRLVVRALDEGEVLQVNIHPGEYVATPSSQPLVILGNVHKLHVRVDIDEHDIPRFKPGSPARASLRGHPQEQFALTFVRVEPYVVPKRSLTGDNTERVDTRVLQVLYSLETGTRTVYVGQQLDVFIETKRASPQSPGGS